MDFRWSGLGVYRPWTIAVTTRSSSPVVDTRADSSRPRAAIHSETVFTCGMLPASSRRRRGLSTANQFQGEFGGGTHGRVRVVEGLGQGRQGVGGGGTDPAERLGREHSGIVVR